MNPIILQTIYYAIVMILTFLLTDFLLQGFLHKYIRVFGSFGRLHFIKIRHTTFDGLAIGVEDEGFTVFKYKKKEYRLPIPNNKNIFYRFLFVMWLDIDGEKWAICSVDYMPVSGSDPVKTQGLIKRIILMPVDEDSWKKIITILVIVVVVAIIGLYIFDYTMLGKIDAAKVAADLCTASKVTPAVVSAPI